MVHIIYIYIENMLSYLWNSHMTGEIHDPFHQLWTHMVPFFKSFDPSTFLHMKNDIWQWKKNGKWCINGEIPDLVTAKDLNFLSKPQHLHPRWIRVADPPQRASQLHHWDATFGSRNTSQVHDFYWISTIGFRWKYLEFSWGVFHGFSRDLRYL